MQAETPLPRFHLKWDGWGWAGRGGLWYGVGVGLVWVWVWCGSRLQGFVNDKPGALRILLRHLLGLNGCRVLLPESEVGDRDVIHHHVVGGASSNKQGGFKLKATVILFTIKL